MPSSHSVFTRAVSMITGLVLAVGLALLGPGQVGVANAAAAPTGLGASGAPVPVLSWDRVAGANAYRVQGSESASFATFVFNQETVNTKYVPTRLLKSGTLYWRVASVDGGGSSAFSEAQVLIGATAPPANLTVSDGSQDVLPPVNPPVITWSPVVGAVSYSLELDAEGDDVNTTLKTNLRTTSYVWPEPQNVEDYFVRVKANFENNLATDWSDWTRYDVDQLPAVTAQDCAAGLVCAPVNGAVRPEVTVQDVALDWDPVLGAQKYEIWVARDVAFSNTVEKRFVLGTQYSPAQTWDNDNYYWKVRAVNAVGEPAPWPTEASRFQRRWPHAPTLVHPLTITPNVGDDLYFQWTPVKHASHYELDLGSDPNFTPGTYDTCRTASTTYTPGHGANDPCMPSQGAVHHWRVRAIDEPTRVQGIYSSAGSFLYTSGVVSRVSPANGDTVAVPTLRWQLSQDAEKYQVVVKRADGSIAAQTITYALSWTPTTALNPADGPFSWSVVAIDSDGKKSPNPPGWTFSLAATPIPGGATPLATLPVSGEPVSSRFPALRWQPIAGAKYYILRVSEAPGYYLDPATTPILRTQLPYPAVTDNSGDLLSAGVRTWWVEAYDEDNVHLGTTSPQSRGTFTITRPDAVGGQAIALDGKALDAGDTCSLSLVLGDNGTICSSVPATPVLDWTPVPGAGGYMVYIAEDPDFTNLVYPPTQNITHNSRWTPSKAMLAALPDNEAGGAYYWFIRPCAALKPFRNCGPDPESMTNAATNAFRKVSPEVQLLSPGDGTTFADEVTFRWKDYALTNAGVTYAGGDAPSHQTALSYEIEVGQADTVIDRRTVDQASYTAYASTYPEGDLWWRVRAIDGAGNTLPWSRAPLLDRSHEVVKATPAANLDPDVSAAYERADVDAKAFPIRSTHVPAGSFPLRWSAENFDSTWAIEVYKNDDTSGAGGNRVLSATSKQAAYVPANLLAPSSEAYRWRIQRTDVSGKPGRWSDYGRFFVDPAQPELVSPADGSAAEPNGPVLAWQALPGAAKYKVEIVSSGGSVVESTTTSATGWAPLKALASGTYTWRVTALDLTGNALGSSARTFVVDAALVALTPPAVTAMDGAKVGSELRATDPTWNRPGVVMTYQWLRNGQPIKGATGTTYLVQSADYATEVSVRVIGSLPSYTSATTTSATVVATAGPALVASAAPHVTGEALVGSSLSTTGGTWPTGTSLTYQWLRDGAPIAGATKSSYTVTVADAATPLAVVVTGKNAGYSDGSATSAPVHIAKMTSTTYGKLSATKIKRGKSVKMSVTVSVDGLAGPTGLIVVKDGRKKIKKITLGSSHKGSITFRLPKLSKRKHKIKAYYLGNTTTKGSTSRALKLVVS